MRARVGRYRAAVSDGHPVADDGGSCAPVAANVPVGVASGAFREEIEHVLALAGLAELVSVIVSIDEVESCKPDPESFIAALTHITGTVAAIAPEHTVVVEDATDGARAARAAGCAASRSAVTHTTRTAARPSRRGPPTAGWRRCCERDHDRRGRVAAAIEAVPEPRGARRVERLGGLTNTNFKVESAVGTFVVRIDARDGDVLDIDRASGWPTAARRRPPGSGRRSSPGCRPSACWSRASWRGGR